MKKLDFLQSEDEFNFARPDFPGGESSINSERNEDDYLRSGWFLHEDCCRCVHAS